MAYPYDPEQAAEMISAAGAEGAQIQLVSTSGRWLKDRELTEAVANFWNEVGLEVEVQIYEFDEYLNRLFDRDDVQRWTTTAVTVSTDGTLRGDIDGEISEWDRELELHVRPRTWQVVSPR